MAFLLLLDSVIPHLHIESGKPEGIKAKMKKTTMMVFAVTLHNIPEGMAVGVTFAGALLGDSQITMAGAMSLALGIAIQNFPEGAIISMPLKSEGISKRRAFLWDALRACRACRGGAYDLPCKYDCTAFAVFSRVCGGGDDICRSGGADSRIAGGRAFEYQYDWRCGGVCDYDDTGCGAWVNGIWKGIISDGMIPI